MKQFLLMMNLLLLLLTATAQSTTPATTAQAIFHEAYNCLYGIGVSYNPQKAVQLFKQAANAGNAAAFNALGNIYVKGAGDVAPDIASAVNYYRQAARKSYAGAYYNLATLYRDGNLLPQDFAQAAYYCKKGAALGNPSCMNLLAYFYFKGLGVPQSYGNAFALYKKLADSGNVNAQYFTGLCYRNGYGVEANQNEAKKWLLKAAGQGDRQATHELTAEPAPENISVISPTLQEQVETLKKYEEKFTASAANNIGGNYKGYAVYYDFSKQYVHQIVPLSLTLAAIPGQDGTYTGFWTESDTLTAPINASFYNNTFTFDSSSRYTRCNYYSYRTPEEYLFNAAQINIKFMGDSAYLTGDVRFYSLSRREPGQPIYIVLVKATENNSYIAAAKLNLAVNPNPASSVANVTFTLNKPGKIKFQLYAIDGKPVLLQPAVGTGEALLPAGAYTYPVNLSGLTAGSYVIKAFVNNAGSESKIFIKL